MTFKVFQCTQCGLPRYSRLGISAPIGGGQWSECAVERGNIAQSTVVRHRVGAQGGGDVHLQAWQRAPGHRHRAARGWHAAGRSR